MFFKFKNIFFLTLAFVLAIQIGNFITEFTKIKYAKSIGYKYEYVKGFGRTIFMDDGIVSNQFDTLLEKYNGNYKQLKASKD